MARAGCVGSASAELTPNPSVATTPRASRTWRARRITWLIWNSLLTVSVPPEKTGSFAAEANSTTYKPSSIEEQKAGASGQRCARPDPGGLLPASSLLLQARRDPPREVLQVHGDTGVVRAGD